MFKLFLENSNNEVLPNPGLDVAIVIIVVLVLIAIVFFSYIFPRIIKKKKSKNNDSGVNCCKK